MQIRVQANKIQLIRSVYNSTTKRCDQKLIGTRDKNCNNELLLKNGYQLRPEEFLQWDKWVYDEQIGNEASKREMCILFSVDTIIEITDAIREDPDLLDGCKALKIYRGLDNLAKILKKNGFKHPNKLVPFNKKLHQIPVSCSKDG